MKNTHLQSILCDLPDSAFSSGGAITDICRMAGYDDAGRVVVNNHNAWHMTVADFCDLIASNPSVIF